MGRYLAVLLIVGLGLAAAPPARGDGAADLDAGRAALAEGDVGKAVGLLESAAQALPQSVEAQLELARCYLQAGRLDKALARYQAVLKLSPEHAEAKRLVEALTGQRQTFEQRLSLARAMIDVGAARAAAGVLGELIGDVHEPEQQLQVRMGLAEAALWQRFTPDSLPEIMRALGQARGTAHEGPARVMAALALVSVTTPDNLAAVEQLLAGIEEAALPEPWNRRAELVRLLVRLDGDAAAVSAALPGPLAALPPGGLRDEVRKRLVIHLTLLARNAADRGDIHTALRIVWPMMTDAAFDQDVDGRLAPGAVAEFKPAGGWLDPRDPDAHRDLLIDALRQIGQAEFRAKDGRAELLGFRLAGAYLNQLPDDPIRYYPIEKALQLADELATLTRPAPERKKGEPLSPADEVQRALLLQLAGRVATGAQRDRLVGLALAQLDRYATAGDLEAGLTRFPTDPADENSLANVLPRGPLHARLLGTVAGHYIALGWKELTRDGAVLAADATLNRFDAAALRLYARLAALYPPSATLAATDAPVSADWITAGQAVVDRYARAGLWPVAAEALGLLYAELPADAARWARLRLTIQQSVVEQAEQLAAHRGVPADLPQRIAAALADAVALVKVDPSEARLAMLRALANELIDGYLRLDREQPAVQVIEAVAGAKGVEQLADWSLATRAKLAGLAASRSLTAAVARFEGTRDLALDAAHAAELKLLGELIDRFTDSKYAPVAVNRVREIAAVYAGHKAFDVAAGALGQFVKAHPKLATMLPLGETDGPARASAADLLTLARARVLLNKAADAFAERTDKTAPPQKLSDEYAAAIDALAGFIRAAPSGPLAPAATRELFAVAGVYGQAGGWAVARQVLARFAAAVPDYRSPQTLRLLEAATWLGELDRGHGLGLLALPDPPAAAAMLIYDVQDLVDPLTDVRVPRSGRGRGSGLWGEESAGGLFGDTMAEESRQSVEGRSLSRPGGPRPADEMSAYDSVPLDSPALRPGTSPPPPPPATPAPSQPMAELHDVPGESLAMIRQSEQQQLRRIAMMNDAARGVQAGQRAERDREQGIILPAGSVLSEAEMKRQDAAADAAYKILIELVKEARGGAGPARAGAGSSEAAQVAERARGQILWLVGFFEGQLRADRAVALVERFLADHPTDRARVALAYQAIGGRLVWAAQRQPTDRIDQAWVDARHVLFEQARAAIAAFVAEYDAPEQKTWLNRARLLAVDSFQREAELVAGISAPRAAGLLARSADELLALADSDPEHPEAGEFPTRLWRVAERLTELGQRDQAIYVLGRIPIRFPAVPLAAQSVLRIAELYAAELSAPLRAVETYQEYLSLVGDNEAIRAQVFAIAGQLASAQRYLEALHVYGVFVDSFPTDARAPQALAAIGQTHQANEAWTEAARAYQRIIDEYAAHAVVPQVKLAIAECDIHLSRWRSARRIYEEYLQQYGQEGRAQAPQQQAQPALPAAAPVNLAERIEVLKSLDRYQTLLADKEVTRNKDDAQFQIGRIVLERLGNRVKAIEEFAKVVVDYPRSHQADNAQLEIGKALMELGRLDEARAALLKVPANYPTSPLADDALFTVGQSYERQAERLAGVTLEKARQMAFEAGQRGAYQRFARQQETQSKALASRRDDLRAEGDGKRLELEEAYNVFRYNPNADPSFSQFALEAAQSAEIESALELANRQDRINEAYRQAVSVYEWAARDYPLGNSTADSLLRMAEIYETQLKDRAAAIETYQRVVRFFPGTPVAENAAWKVAQFHDQEGNHDEAVRAYREFIRTYPASNRVADAQYALAETLEQLGRWVEAMDAYQTFRDKFTTHPRAPAAAEQIQWIRAYRM